MHIKDDFASGAPISQVPSSWFASVARFCNSIIGGDHIVFDKSDTGGPSVIRFDGTVAEYSDDASKLKQDATASAGVESGAARIDHAHPLNVSDSTPSNVILSGTASVGTSSNYARADHSHKVATLTPSKWVKTDSTGAITTTNDTPIAASSTSTGFIYNTSGTISYKAFGTSSDNVSRGNHTHAYGSSSLTGFGTAAACNSTAFAPASAAFPGFGTTSTTAARGNHTHTASQVTDLGTAAKKNVGESGGVQEYSSKLKNLDGKLNSDGTLSSSAVSDTNCTSGGDCLAYFNSDKKLSHLGNTHVTVTKADAMANAFTFNPSTGNQTKTCTLNINAIGQQTAPAKQKVVGFAANAQTASLVDAAVFNSSKQISGGKLVKTNNAGTLEEDDYIHTAEQLPANLFTKAVSGELGVYKLYYKKLKFDKYGRYIGMDSTENFLGTFYE